MIVITYDLGYNENIPSYAEKQDCLGKKNLL